MISYKQARQNQKDNFFELIKSIFNLYIREGEKYYRINRSDSSIIIRESTQKPPSNSLRKDFQAIMTNLKEMGLLEYKNENLSVGSQNSTRLFSSSAMNINKINIQLINKLLDIQPEEIPIQIPEPIQMYMSNFSQALQEYIKKCLQENLREEFEHNPATMVLRSIGLSPIGLTRHLEIPVRLPNDHLGVSNEHYDLVELLTLSQNNDGTRNDPITRQSFNLNQIIPAADVLEQIKIRMLAARNEALR